MRESSRLTKWFYGDCYTKIIEIDLKAQKKAIKEAIEEMKAKRTHHIDSVTRGKEIKLKAFKDINAQLDNYAPKKFGGELEPYKDVEDQRIPAYMLRVRADRPGADYDPFYNPSLLSREGLYWSFNYVFKKIRPSVVFRKPTKEMIKELRDYYKQAKTAEAATKKPA